MSTSIEDSRFKICNASSGRTWIYIINGGLAISTEEAMEVASFKTITK